MLRTTRTLLACSAPRTSRLAREALAVRRFAAPLLGTAAPTGAPRDLPAGLPDGTEAWDVFLLVERCAGPLHERLRVADLLDRLPPAPRQVLERHRTEELRRVLMARGQLQELGRLAAVLEARAVVMKGGVGVAGDEPLDLNDVDLMARAEDVAPLDAALERAGYERRAAVAPGPHLPPHRRAGALAVELHHALRNFDAASVEAIVDRATPLAGAPGLFRPAPADHLWQNLLHLVVQHPERRSCLRDRLLVGAAAAGCTPGELDSVRARIAAHPEAGGLTTLLDTATGVRGDDVALEALAATRYAGAVAVFGSGSGAPPPWLWRPLLAAARVRVEGEPARELWRPLLRSDRRRRPLGQVSRVFLRFGRLALLFPAAASLARAGRGAVGEKKG